MFSPETIATIKMHALSTYPEECCGIVDSAGTYRIMENVAADRLGGFRLGAAELSTVPKPLAIVHSHAAPRHAPWPTAADMRGQVQMGCTWGVVTTDGETAGEILWWGDHVLEEPLVGRNFVPGITDCYALLRAYYWQVLKKYLPEYPRDANWWETGEDMLTQGFAAAGFRAIPKTDVAPGDVVLMTIRSKVPNHCGVVLENGLILHHLQGQLSRREPLGPWIRHVTVGLRHE